MDLEFTCQVSPEDLLVVDKQFFKSDLSLAWVLMSWAIYFGLFLIVRIVPSADNSKNACDCLNPNFEFGVVGLLSAAFVALSLAAGWFNLRKKSAKRYAEHGSLGLPSNFKLTDVRFHNQHSDGTSDHPWDRFSEWMDAGPVLLLLRRAAGIQYIIPKRCLSSQQLDDLIAHLNSLGLKRS